MKRHTLCGLLAMGLILPVAASASGRTTLGVSVTVGSPVVIREEPRVVVVPGSTVYVVQNDIGECDMFRYGVFWYVSKGDTWYRARSHRGPFSIIEVRHVPRAVITVPAKHWRNHPHGGPPGLMKKRGHSAVVIDDDRPRKKSKGHGR